MIHVTVLNRQRLRHIRGPLLKSMLAAVAQELRLDRVELGVTLVNARTMARINEQFLQHHGSTDVITFDHGAELIGDEAAQPPCATRGETVPPPARIYGELFISVADAVAQAGEFGTTWESEVVRYAVHGMLHLLGYDDLRAGLRKKMKREENRLVRRLAGHFKLKDLGRHG